MAFEVKFTNVPKTNPGKTIDQFLDEYNNTELNSKFPDTVGKTAKQVWEEVSIAASAIRSQNGMVESVVNGVLTETYPSESARATAVAAVDAYIATLPKTTFPNLVNGVQTVDKNGVPETYQQSAYMEIVSKYFSNIVTATVTEATV